MPVIGFLGPAAFENNVIELDMGKGLLRTMGLASDAAHEIEVHGTAHAKQISDERCGACHEESLLHYRDTYHGKAMALGRPGSKGVLFSMMRAIAVSSGNCALL